MTRFNLLKQLDVSLASEIIFNLPRKFEDVKELDGHLREEITEEELQQINDAARKEGSQPFL